MSATYEETEEQSDEVVKALACILQQLCDRNDKDPSLKAKVNPFTAFRPPSITVVAYAQRLSSYMGCSPACFVLALVYIDRCIQRSQLSLSSLNIHRLLLTTLVVACKYWDDAFCLNSYYAKVGGVECKELNRLETDFLTILDWDLHVEAAQFDQYYFELARHVSQSNCAVCRPVDVPVTPARMTERRGAGEQPADPQPRPDHGQQEYPGTHTSTQVPGQSSGHHPNHPNHTHNAHNPNGHNHNAHNHTHHNHANFATSPARPTTQSTYNAHTTRPPLYPTRAAGGGVVTSGRHSRIASARSHLHGALPSHHSPYASNAFRPTTPKMSSLGDVGTGMGDIGNLGRGSAEFPFGSMMDTDADEGNTNMLRCRQRDAGDGVRMSLSSSRGSGTLRCSPALAARSDPPITNTAIF